MKRDLAIVFVLATGCDVPMQMQGVRPGEDPLLIFVPPGESASSAMVHEGDAGFLSEYMVYLFANTAYTFQTVATKTGGDPVLHVLGPSGAQVAMDHDSAGGFDARVSFINGTAGWHTVIVRSATTASDGICHLYMNGVLWKSSVVFGGWQLFLYDLKTGEALETVRLPNGAGPTHGIYVLDSNGGIAYRAVGSGTYGAARIVSNPAFGTRRIIVGTVTSSSPSAVAGPIRVIRNDNALPGYDPDADGLGLFLEAELGTCSIRSGITVGRYGGSYDCALTTDARDTDGDGLRDDWEVLGRRDGAHQPLPLWGADPRHKDLFMEVDFMRRTQAENTNFVSMKMPPGVARYMADVYGDAFATDAEQVAHAPLINNPDGQSGIRVHLDTGVQPESPDDATLYGNWGGYNAVNAIQDAAGNWMGQGAGAAWSTNLGTARRGIFRYVLAYGTGGGSQGEGFAISFNMNSAYIAAHESAHAMGLGHSGPNGAVSYVDVNCKPNFPSIMNYAFPSNAGIGFSGGDGAPALNNAALVEYAGVSPSAVEYLSNLESTFQYWVDTTNGSVDWNRDGVIAPPGATVRAYANYTPGGGGCEYTRYNGERVSTGVSQQAPVALRLDGRLYVFWLEAGTLRYTWSTSAMNCPVPAAGCGGLAWSAPFNTNIAADTFDVERYVSGGASRLLLVTLSTTGVLQSRTALHLFGSLLITAPTTLPGTAMAEPSLEAIGDGTTVWLAYKSTDGSIHTNRLSGGGWGADAQAVSAAGAILTGMGWSSPTLFETVLASYPGQTRLYGFFPDAYNSLYQYTWHPEANLWVPVDDLEWGAAWSLYGRAAFAYVPPTRSSAGRVYMYYMTQPAGGGPQMRMRMSYVRTTVTTTGVTQVEKIGLDGPFDNVWAYAQGVSPFFDPGVDTNVRMVLTSATGSTAEQLWIRPKADAIHDFTYYNYEEWRMLGWGICAYVVNPGGTVSSPITCPTRPSY